MGQEVDDSNPLLLARNSHPLYELLGALCSLNPTLDSQIKLTGTLGPAPSRMNVGQKRNIGEIAPLLLIQITGSSKPPFLCFGETDLLHNP